MNLHSEYYVDDMTSNNPYTAYYVNQAGTGLAGFAGVRHQRGRGIFSTLFKTSLLPLLKSMGKAVGGSALEAGKSIARDVIDGQDIKTSAVRHARSQGKKLLSRALDKLDQQEMQKGSGFPAFGPPLVVTKRKRRKSRRKTTKRVAKRKITKTRRTKRTRRTKKRQTRHPPANSLFG